MSKQNGYIGRSPGDSAVIIASQTFEPTGIQTDFTFASGYTVGYLDVYFNGARLIYADDYTASDGSTVGLATYANNGDVIECVAYKAFNVGDVSAAKNNFTVGSAITMTGATGTISATSFSGDGSSLTGVASTDNIITSTASTFTGAVNITGAADGNLLNVSGITTVGILTVFDTTQSTSASTGGLVIHGGVGIAKSLFVDGNVTIGGTLTYEDMTNTDNLGFGTFRKGIEVQGAGSTTTTLNVTGVSTFVGLGTFSSVVHVGAGFDVVGASTFKGVLNAGNDIDIPDTKAIKIGDSDDLWIWHDTSNHSIIRNATGDLRLQSDSITLKNYEGTHNYLTGTESGAVDIYFNNSKKLETHNTGVKVTDNLDVLGIATCGILTAYESITVKVGAGSTELTTALSTKASTGKAIAMAMVFGF